MFLSIIAHTNSKKPRIVDGDPDVLHVYTNQPPTDNRANKAIIEALAQHFKVKESQLQLVSGAKSKTKKFNLLQPISPPRHTK